MTVLLSGWGLRGTLHCDPFTPSKPFPHRRICPLSKFILEVGGPSAEPRSKGLCSHWSPRMVRNPGLEPDAQENIHATRDREGRTQRSPVSSGQSREHPSGGGREAEGRFARSLVCPVPSVPAPPQHYHGLWNPLVKRLLRRSLMTLVVGYQSLGTRQGNQPAGHEQPRNAWLSLGQRRV